jgi:hypothetical protein
MTASRLRIDNRRLLRAHYLPTHGPKEGQMRVLCNAVGLAISLLLPVAAPAWCQDVAPSDCPLIGTAKSAANQALNSKKNREIAPIPGQINKSVTLDAMLAPGDDTGRFSEAQGATITGWVIDVKQGGHPETANCGSMSKPFTDTHIVVGLTPSAAETETLIVEVTPRWRDMMKAKGTDWGTDTLHDQLVGKRVTFTGWLLFDLDHLHEAVNTEPSGQKNWRKTIWEIHPITALQVAP